MASLQAARLHAGEDRMWDGTSLGASLTMRLCCCDYESVWRGMYGNASSHRPPTRHCGGMIPRSWRCVLRTYNAVASPRNDVYSKSCAAVHSLTTNLMSPKSGTFCPQFGLGEWMDNPKPAIREATCGRSQEHSVFMLRYRLWILLIRDIAKRRC